MSITLEIGANTNDTLVLDEADIESLNPVKTHTGVGDFSVSIAGNRSVEKYAKRQDRINIKSDGTTFFSGYLLKVSHNKQRGTTRLQGRGIGKKLQETRPNYDALGGSLTYTDIALEDAIDDYWSRTPFSASVTPQSTDTIATDDQLISVDTSSEWTNNVTIPSNTPVEVNNSSLELLQVSYVAEGESQGNVLSDVSYSGGEALSLAGGISPSYNFNLDYTIPQSDAEIYFRGNAPNGTHDGFDIKVNGTVEASRPQDSLLSGVQWRSINVSSDLSSPGVEFDSDGNSTDAFELDIVAVVDTRYVPSTGNLDNTVDSNNGHLDDPQLYPDSVAIETDEYTTTLNIGEATLNTTFNDTSEDQQLGLSFDSGGTFTRGSNTNSFTDQADATRNVSGELSLAGYPFGSNAQNATPRFGYNGQAVDSFEILVDTNNLVVIDELELSKNHFDNLQTLHEYGSNIWVIEHDDADIANLTVNSFNRGDETRTLPSLTDNDINKTPRVDSSQYYNSIFVQGALVSGSRPTAEAKDSTAIANDRGEISPGVLRDLDVVTSGGATFRAQSLLDKAQRNSELRGQKVTPAVDLSPGYAYAVDFGDGLTEFTAEEVSISKGTDRAETTLDFIPRNDISQDIAELRRNARKTKDQV